MELKVWVEGVVRVVCGLSLNTSCQDVVIALAQAIGQTGRYILILKMRGTERQLVADDCPLQALAQLGQLSGEVEFILRRTGSSGGDGPNRSSAERLLPLPRRPEPLKHKGPQKALTFNLGPSTVPRRIKANRAWSPSPRASPEPRASPVSFLDPLNPVMVPSSYPSKEEVFRQVLQQQERLRDLEIQLQALEAEFWEGERSSTPVPGLALDLMEGLEVLEVRLRENEAELRFGEHWNEQLQVEMDRERDMHRRLDQVYTSLDNHSYRLQELQAHSAHLEQDIRLEDHSPQRSRPGTPPPDETLGALKQELHHRFQQGEELDTTLYKTERELLAAEARLQETGQAMEELNKELRQCNLQQFIQHTGVTPAPPPTDQPDYLSNAGILEEEQPDPVTVCNRFVLQAKSTGTSG